MKKTVKNHLEKCDKIFPDHWCVPQEIVTEFCLVTREQLVELLSASKDIDAVVLQNAIVQTINFEKEMHTRYHVVTDDEFAKNYEDEVKKIQQALDMIDEEKEANITDSESIKQRFLLVQRKRQLEKELQERESNPDIKPKKETKKKITKNYSFRGIISSIFEDYMNAYVEFEEKCDNCLSFTQFIGTWHKSMTKSCPKKNMTLWRVPRAQKTFLFIFKTVSKSAWHFPLPKPCSSYPKFGKSFWSSIRNDYC